MTISAILGYLSLAGYLARFGQSLRLTWVKSQKEEPFYNHGFEKVRERIAWALRHCFHDGFIVIEDRKSERFVQFRKYIPLLANHGYGLELGFPEAPWSKAYYTKLRDLLTAERIPFREARETLGDVTAFIHVDCGQDVELAADLTRRCFFDIFGLAPDARFKSSVTGYSDIGDEVIDRSAKNHSTFRGFWRALRAKVLAEGGFDLKLLLRFAGYGAGFMFLCYPALWWTWFRADAAAPDWHVAFGPIEAAGSHTSWILLLVFWVAWSRFITLNREVAKFRTRQTQTLIDKISWPLIARALPMAVITSWLGM